MVNPLSKYRDQINIPQVTTAQQTSTNPLSKYRPSISAETTLPQRAWQDIKTILPSTYNPRIIAQGLGRWFYEPYKELYTTGIGKQISEQPGYGPPAAGLLSTLGAIPKAILEPPIKTTAQWITEPEKKVAEYAEHPIAAPLSDIMGAYIAGAAIKGIFTGALKGAMTPIEIAERAPGGTIIPKITREGIEPKYIEPPMTGVIKPAILKQLQKYPAGEKFIEIAGLKPEQQSLFALTREYYTKLRKSKWQIAEEGAIKLSEKLTPDEKLIASSIIEGTTPTTEAQANLLREAILPEGKVAPRQPAYRGLRAKTPEFARPEDIGFSKSEALYNQLTEIKPYEVVPGSNLDNFLNAYKKIASEEWQYAKSYANPPRGKGRFEKVEIPEEVAAELGIKKPIRMAAWGKAEAARWQPLEKMTGRTKYELQNLGIEEPSYYPHIWEKTPSGEPFSTPYTRLGQRVPPFLKERLGKEGYIRDISIAIPIHRRAFVRWKLTGELVDDIIGEFGRPIKRSEILPGYKSFTSRDILPPGMSAEEIQAFGPLRIKQKIQLPNAIIRELNTWVKNPSRVEQFLRSYIDPTVNVWRISVLALSPRWLVNNFIGNLILNTLGKVSPEVYFQGLSVVRKALLRAKEENISLISALEKEGIPYEASEGMLRGELAPRLGQPQIFQTIQKFVQKPYEFNSMIETYFRTSHYLDKINKGFGREEAIASVDKLLFNYHALSYIDRTIGRRIFPFWAWNKNVTRLALSYPFEHPLRAAILAKADVIGTDLY